MQFLKVYDGLGSQISQISALFYLSGIDHFIKEVLKCKYYERYMDDGYIIDSCKERLLKIRSILIEKAKEIGLIINISKTKIYKTSNFIILKRHWKVQGKKLSIIPIYINL